MSFGMRIWGNDGALQLDENSFTVRIVYSELVQKPASGRSVFISIPGINATDFSAVCLPVVAYDKGSQYSSAIQFTPIISAGGITVYFGSPAANTGPVGTTPQRLLVMRYR